jgi:hypothetical protein
VDNECIHRHSPSSCAATALDDILGTHELRLHLGGGLCHMVGSPLGLDRLRRLARELFGQPSPADAE